ncbi:hypothetical protein EEL32_12180 [Brevibacillus laterosporus]|nr:hypothetical protein [Brevibacillus laterosporus]TPG86862.1 hypothetical protein EEL32_12180 [Brevibacillus laterosporus]
MTEQQIIETLATKVMGWDIEDEKNFRFQGVLEVRDCLNHFEEWNPLQNIADAWQLVDKIGPFEYRKSPALDGDYQHFAKFFYHGHWYSGEGENVQDAICRAVLKAYRIDLTLR